VRPIPKRLLIHSAVLKSPTGTDAWQDRTWNETPLRFVRLDPSEKVVMTKDNTEVQLTSTLFYDCKNSDPPGIRFSHGQKIKWNGREYTVETAEEMYDERRLHHWEVGLT
jgi:hypothetical protein